MSQGFLIWNDFHPILVGAGCLALGYVYGRHCRSVSEIPAEVPPASDDVCCAQSQSNTYFEDLERPCKCCVSASGQLDGNGKRESKFTRSPYLVQDAAEGFEQAEKSTKRGLPYRLEKLEYTDAEAQGMRQLSCGPYFEKGYQVLEEDGCLQAKTPFKRQKGSLGWKGKAEMGFDPLSSYRVNTEDDSAAPWSRDLLHKRVNYFNNVSETSAETVRTDESRKLRLIKKKFLQVSSTAEPAYDSTSATPDPTGVVRSGSSSGLVQLVTLPQADDNQSPTSPYRISGGGCRVAALGKTSIDPVLQKTFGNTLPSFNGPEINYKDGDTLQEQLSCESHENQGNEVEAVSVGVGVAGSQFLPSVQAELLQIPSATCRAPQHYGISRKQERSLSEGNLTAFSIGTDACELPEDVPGDEDLKAEICELFNETDCSKVSFEEIVSVLEKRLKTNLQERKAFISDLVREAVNISKLLENERATTEESSQATTVQSRVKYASSSRLLGKWPFSYDCP